MKLLSLIHELTRIYAEHGDLEVCKYGVDGHLTDKTMPELRCEMLLKGREHRRRLFNDISHEEDRRGPKIVFI